MNATVSLLRRKQKCRESVWWLGIDRDIERFVSDCNACVLADKDGQRMGVPPVKPIPYPEKPWSKLSIDILGELHGLPYNSRFVIVLLDFHRNRPKIRPLANIRGETVIEFLSDLFA